MIFLYKYKIKKKNRNRSRGRNIGVLLIGQEITKLKLNSSHIRHNIRNFRDTKTV
jgi:hypothetical protein